MNYSITDDFTNSFDWIFPTRYSIYAFDCSTFVDVSQNKVIRFFSLQAYMSRNAFLIDKFFCSYPFKTCAFYFGIRKK